MKRVAALLFLSSLCWQNAVFCRGDKVIPQVADGPNARTKLDFYCPSTVKSITNYRVRFYHNDGTLWSLDTSQGTGYQFDLDLPPRTKVRIETLGHSIPDTAGYAVVEDREPENSTFSEDYTVGISVFYEIYSNGAVVDTVSVPVLNLTSVSVFPVESNPSNGLRAAYALVNRAPAKNTITARLFNNDGVQVGNDVPIELAIGEHLSEYLNQKFSNLAVFSGTMELAAQGPVSMLALLETQTANGLQYSTLAGTDKEAMRTNTNMLLQQALFSSDKLYTPMDLDAFVVDYFKQEDAPRGCCETWSWDVKYVGVNSTTRSLRPATGNGARMVALGIKTVAQFDAISLLDLKGLTYDTADIDLSDGSSNLQIDFVFAVRTDIGNYAKVRIANIIPLTGNYKDLDLEVYTYK